MDREPSREKQSSDRPPLLPLYAPVPEAEPPVFVVVEDAESFKDDSGETPDWLLERMMEAYS